MAERAGDALAFGVLLPASAPGLAAAETFGGAALSMGGWGGALVEDDGGNTLEGPLTAADDADAGAPAGTVAAGDGTNTTSPSREEDSHGVCRPSVSVTTPERTCLKTCSILRPGTVMACRRCLV